MMVDIAGLSETLKILRRAQAEIRYAQDLANIAVDHPAWISFNDATEAVEKEIRKLKEAVDQVQKERRG